VITSAIPSPRLRQPLALAVVRTEHLKPGTAVEVAYGERMFPGQIIRLPVNEESVR
jgi:glycine cleavage system aminomethyltransferase T